MSESFPPLEGQEHTKRRREWLAAIVLAGLFVGLTALEFKFTRISSTLPFVNSIFFFGLININLIILIAMVWLVSRNIGKLFIERRRKILGSRLKTRLVISFLGLSIIPTLVLFVISVLYINSSFDKWFSLKIQNTLQASLEITRTFYKNADQTALHFADHIAKALQKKLQTERKWLGLSHVPPSSAPSWLLRFLEDQRDLLALDAVEYYFGPLDQRVLVRRPLSEERPRVFPRLSVDLLERAFSGETVSSLQRVGAGDLIRTMVPVRASDQSVLGVVVVSNYILLSLVNKVDEISNVFEDYQEVNPLKYPVKTTYLVILVMITLVLIFVAIWVGLYMARELTVPLERLVQGAQAVGAGNLGVRIAGAGSNDEIAVLIESFNRMTADLSENRRRLVQASADLEKRRLQLEAVLANVGTGVVVVDQGGVVTTFNRAASVLLGIPAASALGKPFDELFLSEGKELVAAVHDSLAALSTSKKEGASLDPVQWTMRSGLDVKNYNAVLTPLKDLTRDTPTGVVVVIDDLTHLVKGQREMAWREVARRIAHEIKNPLTPIKLSAQRLQRRLSDLRGRDATLLKDCTDTIIRHTDELKEMVNEFSNFARFPEISPSPNDLNGAVWEVVSLYSQAHKDIRFPFLPDQSLPIFEFDRDQLKRVLINLFDNAVAVAPREVRVETHYNSDLQMAALIVTDNGPGMSEEVQARVFEPYFSTKSNGSGLGLAIVKRIINDHDGFIRVQSAPGEGTQFLIELPTGSRQRIVKNK